MLNLFKKAKRAFTLVEISVTLAVIAVLLAVFIPSFSLVQTQAMVTTMRDQMVTGYNAIRIQDGMDGSFEYSNGVILAKSVNSNKLFYTIVKNGRPMETEYVTDRVKHEWTANVFYGVPGCQNSLAARIEDNKIIIYADPDIENNDTAENHLTTVQAAHVVFHKESKLNKAGRGGVLPDMPIQKNDNGLVLSVKFISTGNNEIQQVVFDGIEEGKTVGELNEVSVSTQPTFPCYCKDASSAGCETPGKGKCIYCEEEIEWGEPLGHKYKEVTATAPTCTTPGVKAGYVCERCGKLFDTDKDEVNSLEGEPALDHDFSSQTATATYLKTAATCTEDEEYYYKCIRCDEKGEESWVNTGTALDHDFTSKTATSTYLKAAATCTEDEEYYYKCSRCDEKGEESWSKDGTALDHDFTAQTTNSAYLKTAATCTDDAVYYYKCSRCDAKDSNTWTKANTATGHRMSGWTHTATCTSGGYKSRYCLNGCGLVNESVWEDAKGHDWQNTSGYAATCTTPGRTAGQYCPRCGASSGSDEIPAPGHSWGEWVTTTAATCTKKGEQTRTCQRDGCGETETNSIPLIAHNYSTTGATPTYTNIGTGRHLKVVAPRCTSCGARSNETTSTPENCTYGSVTVTSEPTCTENGVGTKTCTKCNNTVAATVAALGHEWCTDTNVSGVNFRLINHAGWLTSICNRGCGAHIIQMYKDGANNKPICTSCTLYEPLPGGGEEPVHYDYELVSYTLFGDPSATY